MVRFSEEVAAGWVSSYECEQLTSERSAFQQIDIYAHPTFGRMLVLDGLLQTTERDEFCYHEMLVHVPLLTLEEPRRVLIIGGGDGGTLRHVLMHPSVERAVMCEIDERVTALCRRFLPAIGGDAFEDPRAQVLFDDGIAFVAEGSDVFDAIIVDSSDPVGPGEGLFTSEFYRSAAARLTPGGVVCIQSGSPFFQQDELHRAHTNMKRVLPDVRTYLGHVPTYPGTAWTYTLGGDALMLDPDVAGERALKRGLAPRYWTTDVQRGAFCLPAIAADVVAPDGPPHTWGLSPEERERRSLPGV